MYRFKIDRINVNTVDGIQTIVPKKINIIVGPNNSGKSRLLKEIRDYLSGDRTDIKILADINCALPKDFYEFNEAYNVESKMVQDLHGNWMLKVYTNKPNSGLDMTASLESYFTRNINMIGGSWRDHYTNIIAERNTEEFFNCFGALFYQYLGTEERLTICKTQRNYGMDSNSTNYLSSFRFNEELLADLASKVKMFFKKDIYLDSRTLGDRLVFRVGEDFEYIRNASITNEGDANRLFREKKLDDQGDGLKSFVSTFLSLNHGKSDILLLDEPEAFLHPPLARQIGEMIGESQSEGKTIFIATHSVEILKGILSKCTDVNVIRITQPQAYTNEIKKLDQTVLNDILQNPLLRVSRVLEGIFCERVIITEAEADELVYQELIEKIFPESGLFFAHGQNKQTLSTIAALYKKIGIDYEIITDFDVLRVPAELYSFLLLMPLEERDRQRFQNYATRLREEINAAVDTNGLTPEEVTLAQKQKRDEVYHKQGIRYFNEKYSRQIESSLEKLSSFHLHILETGELETLLEDFGVRYQEKNKWIVEAINKISELNVEEIKQESIVYRFVSRIVKQGLDKTVLIE